MIKKYKHICSTFDVLLWESELEPKPYEHLITFPAVEGDLAKAEDKEYIFQNGAWRELESEESQQAHGYRGTR